MEQYCENCGAKLKNDSNFCSKCGYNLLEELKPCPNCGKNMGIDDEFCDNCGYNFNVNQSISKEKFVDKYRAPLVIIAIVIFAVVVFALTPAISNILVGSQVVSVNEYDFKIPANFEYDAVASAEEIEEQVTHKEWKNGNEYVEIAIISYDSDVDIEKILVSLGGYRESKYGFPGHHYQFRDGNESFSYISGNDMISIIVSDSKLFDRIEPL